jgi:hypothetical protein
MIRGVPPCSYRIGRDRQSSQSRCEQPRLASPIFLGLANDKRIYELCNPQRFGNRAPPLPPGSRSTTGFTSEFTRFCSSAFYSGDSGRAARAGLNSLLKFNPRKKSLSLSTIAATLGVVAPSAWRYSPRSRASSFRQIDNLKLEGAENFF